MTLNSLTKHNTLASLTSSSDGVKTQLAGVSNFMEEIWKDIKGAEGFYQISNLGRVKSLKRKRVNCDRIIKLSNDSDGYKIYFGTIGDRKKTFKISVSRCVAKAFICGENEGVVCHKDGDKTNNVSTNLYFGDVESNTLDKYLHGSTKLSIKQTKEIRELYPEYSQKELSIIYGVMASTISRIVNNKRGKFV